MIQVTDILAQERGLDDLLYLAVFLAVGAIAAISKWLKKKAEEKEIEQRQRQIEDRQKGHAWQQSPQQTQETPQPQPTQAQQARQTPYEPIPARPSPPPMPQRRRRRQPAKPAEEIVVLEPAGEHQLVHAEVAMPSGVHHDPYAARAEIGKEPPVVARGPAVDLSDRDKLRQAVLLREILGPPAALRDQGQEGLW